MKRNLLCALATIAISGCGSEPVALEKLPAADSADAGEVVVIRPSAFIGEDVVYIVSVDKKDIARLGSRQHQRFNLPAGDHRIAIRVFGLGGDRDHASRRRRAERLPGRRTEAGLREPRSGHRRPRQEIAFKHGAQAGLARPPLERCVWAQFSATRLDRRFARLYRFSRPFRFWDRGSS
jgi:hypothetical protein